MITQLTGNGRLLLTVNESGEWSNLFYPYPGQFQHLQEMRFGVFDVDRSKFTWLRNGNGFSHEQPATVAESIPLTKWVGDGLTLSAQDHVHPNHDLIIRVIRVSAPAPRRLRLFAYHSMKIAESLYQETAYVDPDHRSLVHYKRGFYFQFFGDPPFTKAVCGEHTLKGLQGSYVDAEDGTLEGRAIAHGAADSVMEWDIEVGPGNDRTIRQFLAVGQTPEASDEIREYVRSGGPGRFEHEAQAFWQAWVSRRLHGTPPGLSERAQQLYHASVLVLRHSTGTNGSIVASPDTTSLVVGGDTYNYCWWRDGGYVSKAMDEAGLYENAHRFFQFARSCQSPDGSFRHRHFPDGKFGSTWHPPPFLQIDQTATVVSALWHHFKRGADPDVLLDHWPMVKGAANFLAAFRDPETRLPSPSFDLWEERKGIHLYSTAAVAHALERAGRIADELGKDPTRWRAAAREVREAAVPAFWNDARQAFARSLSPSDDRLDSSVLLALKLGLIPWADPRARKTVDDVERRLGAGGSGGLARYEGDSYYGAENPWIVCTLWLAEARLMLGDRPRCLELIEWAAARATPTLLLPEQVDRGSGAPKSATPLTWSHSTYVDVIHKYERSFSATPSPDE